MNKKVKITLGSLILCSIMGCTVWTPTPKKPSPPMNVAHKAPAQTRPSYQQYAYLLQLCVNNGRVDFAKLRSRKQQLKSLLRTIARLDRDKYNHWSSADQTAFWINVYNMQTLRIVLDNYPIKGSRWLNPIYGPNSLRHIKGLKTDYKFLVMDEEFTLAELERRFFHTSSTDPRFLFSLAQLSQSSPHLRSEPYEGNRLNEQLDDHLRRFLGSVKGLRIDRQRKRVYLSSLFKATWYGKYIAENYAINRKFKDHTPNLRAVLHFISLYVDPADKTFLEIENYSVEFMKYDWTLNDMSQRR